MVSCEECKCVSADADGWAAYLANDPDDLEDPVVVLYCPPCALREFERPMPGPLYP